MNNMEDKIVTIDRVRYSGKWVEFWFQEGDVFENKINFHASLKVYKLNDAIERADLFDQVMSTGLKGIKIKWKHVSPNWEIVDLLKSEIEVSSLLVGKNVKYSTGDGKNHVGKVLDKVKVGLASGVNDYVAIDEYVVECADKTIHNIYPYFIHSIIK